MRLTPPIPRNGYRPSNRVVQPMTQTISASPPRPSRLRGAAKRDEAGMATETKLPPVTAEARRIAAERFERANQVIQTGNYDYAIQLLLGCIRLVPDHFVFRQTLRRTQKAKFSNNLRGSRLAFLTTFRTRAKLKNAKRTRSYREVLEYGETILSKNPWDVGVQMDMAEAADALGLMEHAVFILTEARQKDPNDPTLNRALARLLEKCGRFTHAIQLWQLVREAVPNDVEAAHKAKDLAASETIKRGNYGAAVSDDDTASKPVPADEQKTKLANEPPDRVAREAAPILARLESNPSDPNLYLQLATVYRRGNQFDRARAALEQGLGPTGKDFRLMLELMEMDLEPFRRNLAIAEKKLADHNEDDLDNRHTPEDLQRIKTKILKEINNREMELYRLKVDRYPQDLSNRLELGLRFLQADMVDEAIVEFQTVRKDQRLAWRASLQLGNCFRKRNNWRLAQRNYEDALTQLPGNEDDGRKEVLFQLANGLADAGELQRAVDLGTDLANMDFGYRGIGKLLDDWNQQLQEA